MEINTPLIITLIILCVLVILFISALFRGPKISSAQKSRILSQLDEIKYSMTVLDTASKRDGIVRLDALLSKTMQVYFSNSDKCGDNLKRLKGKISRKLYEEMWKYHKVRNNVVHENVDIEDKTAANAFHTYSEVISKLLQ